MYVVSSTLDLVGCTFLDNSANSGGPDLYLKSSTVNMNGCQAGFSGTVGAALRKNINSASAIYGTAQSYLCNVCER